MSLWRQLTRGLHVLTHRAAADRDLADELEHYVGLAAAEHEARGLSPAQARRAARLEAGNADAVREQVRGAGWESLVESVLADVRYAGRSLRRNAGFATVCVLTLGLGIGASTTIFSAVGPILFEPLPYPHAERVVSLAGVREDGSGEDVTYGTFVELSERARSFTTLAVADAWQPALMGLAEPERLSGDRVSAGYFRALGVAPVGRDFTAADDQVGAPRVAILSDGLARRRFGSPLRVLGRQVTLDGDSYTVIGVMPAGFDNVLAPAAEIWAPRRYRAHASFESAEWGHHLRMVGRLQAGVSVEQARRDVTGIARTPAPEFPRPPWADLKQGLRLEALQAAVVRGVRPALLAIVGAVLLLLAVAGANVTNLLLARAAQRSGELALRATLGAGRARLARQLLTESVLLAGLGGTVGVALALVGVRALVGLAPSGLPRADAIGVNGYALAFALVLTMLVALAVGVAPAALAARRDLRAGAASRARATSAHHLRRSLVVGEVGLALVLLVGAGLMLRSLQHLFAAAPGFEASHVLTMEVVAAGHTYDSDAARQRFFEEAVESVRHVPGVTAAAFSSQLPLSGDLDAYGIAFESIPRGDPNDYGSALRYTVTPGWFAAMRIPLRRGRLFDDRDRPGTPQAVLINASLARRLFSHRDPIGQRVRMGPALGQPGLPAGIVVGVVGDVKQTSLALGDEDAFYVPMGQWSWVDNVQSLVVRTTGDPLPLVPAVKRALWSVDRNNPILRIDSMEQLVAASEARRRFVLVVFEAFALAALLLAAVGIYGVLAGSVTERTREIGVRAALGASRESIMALVLRQGLTLAGLGVALGLLGAAAATRAIASLLFGLSRLDPLTHLGVVGLLGSVATIACAIPAWRAARVDPATALRAD